MNGLLTARGLRKVFRGGDGQPLEVLRGVDLDVPRGEFIAIVGASGAGKSTLLHLLGALDQPSSGDVWLDGSRYTDLGPAGLAELRNRKVGFVFQFHFLLPDFTALENVMMPALVARRTVPDATREASHWLERVGLADRVTHRPGELSGGEQQRVAIARALVNRPAVVFADEPTGNLDDATGEGIHRLIRDLADSERETFVVVTHKRQFGAFADRTLELAGHTLRELER